MVEAELKALVEEGIKLDTDGYRLLVNPTGRFEIGGPMGDAGLTGRKIIIDTYGGMARHGGGAFSGKDPSKVDRSAAYAMRWVAKNVVAAGLASRCEVQVAYAIGKAEPVGLFVETFGTHTVGTDLIEKAIDEVFDLRPAAIIRDLDLLRPIYAQTAAYGHFGRELPDFTWERTDRARQLRAAATSEAPGAEHHPSPISTESRRTRCTTSPRWTPARPRARRRPRCRCRCRCPCPCRPRRRCCWRGSTRRSGGAARGARYRLTAAAATAPVPFSSHPRAALGSL